MKNFIWVYATLAMVIAGVALDFPASAADGSSQTEKTRQLMQDYFALIERGDIEEMPDHWAENDSELEVMNPGPWGGYYFGRESVRLYYQDMAAMFDPEGGLKVDLLSLIAEGNKAAIRFRVRAKHKAGHYDNQHMQVYTWRDGKIVKMDSYYDWEPFERMRQKAVAVKKRKASG